MRHDSGLEEQLLDLFERSPQVVDYCEQPFSIDYIWSSRPRVYIPDFAVRLADGRSARRRATSRAAVHSCTSEVQKCTLGKALRVETPGPT